MNKATGPSASVTDVSEHPTECPQCGAITRVDHGSCINCLLREGLEAKGQASRETFESILTEANVTDKLWRLGHYEILEEIGRGGMGVIYRARQQHSRRIVAVKRILAHEANSHEALVRFRREAEAVASLDHPNILPIYEVSESEEGLPFFSMKYATGGSLRTAAPALRAKPRECVRLMAKVARGIAYAHCNGVLHRDLQPGNILLDEDGEPMVSDFGLAKWLDQNSDLTRTLETLGTPGYIAPEQAECRTADLTGAADIYSLGAILFYLLTGRPPFVGANVLVVIHQAAATPAPRLRSLAPSLDRDLETIVGRCLESDPNARYQSAGALAEDLEHWLRDEPIRARRNNAEARALYATIYRRRGEWRRSLAEYARAAELNPRDSSSYAEVGNNLLYLRRWSDAEHALTRALAIDPHNALAALFLANTNINGTGDIRRARQAWEGVPADNKHGIGTYGASIAVMIDERVYLDVLEKHFAEALKAWDTVPTNTLDARLRQLEARVGIQVLAGQNVGAKSECEQTRVLLEAQVAERAPEDRTALTALAWVYVCLGRNADALQVAQQAADSLSIERDGISGPNLLIGLAQIEAHIGRPEEAVKILRRLLTIPAGQNISIARLKIDPVWDPIRNDPGFQKLLSEPEPETVYK